MLETFLQDLRFGARMLRKNPGFTAARGAHARARYRREHRYLQRCKFPADHAAAFQTAGKSSNGLGNKASGDGG